MSPDPVTFEDEECPSCTLSVLVHGESKAGKSTLAATSPLPILVLDAEGGWKFVTSSSAVVKAHGRKLRRVLWDPTKEAPPKHDGTWDVCAVQVHDWSVVQRTYQWLKQKPHDFKSVVIDSITEIQRRCTANLKPDPTDQFKIQDWGVLLRLMDTTIRAYRDLTEDPNNTIRVVMCTAETKKPDKGKYSPNVQGSLSNNLPYYFDVVGYLFKTPTMGEDGTPIPNAFTRNLLVSSHDPNFLAGSRVEEQLGAVVVGPSITGILDTIYNDNE